MYSSISPEISQYAFRFIFRQIVVTPYIIGWLFVVNTFSAIAGYFLLSRAITSNANFSDIVCGVLILCSELISTNLSICAFLLLKYGSYATISCRSEERR